jgi:hypothetical protein
MWLVTNRESDAVPSPNYYPVSGALVRNAAVTTDRIGGIDWSTGFLKVNEEKIMNTKIG